ncbi:MAG: 16S rRNA (cytosine(1402)-N(4))-methyltransferase RsmH [Bacillota bacterium]
MAEVGSFHQPVMPNEVLAHLKVTGGPGVYVDGTVGGGGHARLLAEGLSPRDLLIGIDLDPEALRVAADVMAGVPPRVELVHANFRFLPALLEERGIDHMAGCFLDLGVSSHQLDCPGRGFSYRCRDAPLDMRMNPGDGRTAADVLNRYPQRDIARILRQYGEERWARRIASFIVRRRKTRPFETAGDLIDVIMDAIPAAARRRGGHPARRTFQALRIEVNGELEGLSGFLEEVIQLLRPGGRLVVITFHSLEDRPVKRVFRKLSRECRCPPGLPVCRCGGPVVRDLTPKPIRPTEAEVNLNPRSSSAKLRAVERL